MLKHAWHVLILCAAVILIYWPQHKASFVIDDYYTVVQNPLIKQPALYPKIWTSRLFDAHQSAEYIKLLYYRPVLMSSYALDYKLGGLNPIVFKWGNILIHAVNAALLYALILLLFTRIDLAFYAALLWALLPSHEWVVRYITGRGDSLQVLFGLACCILFVKAYRLKKPSLYVLTGIFMVLSALTREFGFLMPLYLGIIYLLLVGRVKSVAQLGWWWIMVGLSSLAVSFPLIYKCGNIQALHLMYFTSIGLCLWVAQTRRSILIALVIVCAVMTYNQGRFWKDELTLLRHTRQYEWWPLTATHQQLLMKYDTHEAAIKSYLISLNDKVQQSMWHGRLGDIAFMQGDLLKAKDAYQAAIELNPNNVDALNNLAVVYLNQGDEERGLQLLTQSLGQKGDFAVTLRLLGLYYYRHQDFSQARAFLQRALFYNPDEPQAKELLATLNHS